MEKFREKVTSAAAALCTALLLSVAPGTAEARDNFSLEFQETTDQNANWQNGVQYIDVIGVNSVVRIINIQDEFPDDQSTFRVFVLSGESQTVEFGPDSVWIEHADEERLEMVTYEDLQGRLRRDVGRRSAIAAIGNAFSAMGANGQRTGDISFNGMSNQGQAFHGSGTISYYDQNLARQQQQNVANQSAAIAASLQTRQLRGDAALTAMLRQHTVQHGEIVGGTVAFDAPRWLGRLDEDERITIVVRFGAEEHRIVARVSEIR